MSVHLTNRLVSVTNQSPFYKKIRLKRRSLSASCACTIPKYYFLKATYASRVVATPGTQYTIKPPFKFIRLILTFDAIQYGLLTSASD
jgi:hypothetical protein